MNSSIAFVGAGPTTIYTLHALVEQADRPFSATIFEEQASAGHGTPYRPGWNDPAMLSNIASIEIPPLEQTLVGWLRAQPAARLTDLRVDPDKIGERIFYPRLALGEFLSDQFAALLDRARAKGHRVVVRTHCRISDAVSRADGMTLTIRPRFGPEAQEFFDHVVLATGHQWPIAPEVRPGYFLSPWPASALADIPPVAIGIRGSSLSAIDAAVALAVAHGRFVATGDGMLRYAADQGTAEFHMTMMSRKGLLPEADFYSPLPYEPLSICTPAAIGRLIAAPGADLLDRAFALFKQELSVADPAYAARMRLADIDLEGFCDSYFGERTGIDPFAWARTNLAEAEHNYAAQITVPWRYAILRMHEVMALLVPHLTHAEFKRFSRFFKPMFVDDYATVPHESIKRLLALHDAGKLDVIAIGEDYRIDGRRPEGGAVVHIAGRPAAYPVFIEATGQRPLAARQFPFPSLLRQGIIRDEAVPDGTSGSRGIVIDERFHPVSAGIPLERLFCLSLPFILGRHPFIQGITSSHDMGLVVAGQLAAAIARDDARIMGAVAA